MFKEERELSNQYVKQLNIRTPSIQQRARNLSGGINEGRYRQMVGGKAQIVMDEPTCGVDVGAKIEIYNLMHQIQPRSPW
jgi:ABC-type sugar transport system ATPase subunit